MSRKLRISKLEVLTERSFELMKGTSKFEMQDSVAR